MITDLYSLLAAADCLLLRKYCEILWMSLPRFLFTGYRFFTRYAALHLCGSIQYELPAFTYLPFHVHQVVGTISLLLSMKGLSRGELPMQYHSHIEGLLPVDFPLACTSFFNFPFALPVLYLGPPPDLPSGDASFTLYMHHSRKGRFCQHIFAFFL